MSEKLSEQMSLRLPYTTMRTLKDLAGEMGRSAYLRTLIERAEKRRHRSKGEG